MPLAVVIMAAGKGTRMKSDLPKVLHQANGHALIDYVIKTALSLQPWKTILVVGHQAALVRKAAEQFPVISVLQEPQLGTGHAVMQAEDALRDFMGEVLILSGDAPLVRPETLHQLLKLHRERKAAATVLTAELADPAGYGRIVRSDDGENVLRIVEQKDGSEAELRIQEINSGVYVFDAEVLFSALESINTNNAQNEYYLTDVFGICFRKGLDVCALKTENPEEILGINTPEQLREVELELLRRGAQPA
jgi:UDP-N-acetylglucosamine pyrophosphorylase